VSKDNEIKKKIYSPKEILKKIPQERCHNRWKVFYKILADEFIYKNFSRDTSDMILRGYSYIEERDEYKDIERIKILILCTTYLLNEDKRIIDTVELKNYIDIETPYKFICWSFLRSIKNLSPKGIKIFIVLNNLLIDSLDIDRIQSYLLEEYKINDNELKDFINESLLINKTEDNKIEWSSSLIRYIRQSVGEFYFQRQLRMIEEK